MATYGSIRYSGITDAGISGGGVDDYNDVNALPQNPSLGDLAFITTTNTLYVYNGSAWFNIAIANQAPTAITGNQASYELATDGTPTVVTLVSSDPEGFPLTWSATTSGDTQVGTLTQADNVFTVTPSTDELDVGTLSVTFSVTDGNNTETSISSFTLAFLSPLWDETVLSIGTNSTDGLNNSTFIDRSTNAHTVTPTGTPTQTAFHPYLDNWSVEFDGTNGDYLRCDEALDSFANINDVFTIEAWLYPTVAGDSSAAPDDYFFGLNRISDGNNQLGVGMQNIYYAGDPYNLNNIIETHKWTHIAVVFDGTDLKIYTDGVLNTTITDTVETPLQDLTFGMGTEFDSSSLSPGNYYSGYMSNVRVSDIVRYTTTFDPPTSAFIDDENTTFIGCQSNRFIDTSSNGNTIVVVDNPKVSAFNPFGQDSEYAVGENKGSTYFDGVGDYLDTETTLKDLGTDDFTIELFINPADVDNKCLIDTRAGGNPSTGWLFFLETEGITFYHRTDRRVQHPVPINAWTHVAVTRESGTLRLFVNGTLEDSTSYTFSLNDGDDFKIGSKSWSSSSVEDFQGYISDLRIVKGTALYTSDFTPPTAPVGNTNASLYLPMDNAGIFDKTGLNTLTVVGDASTSTTQTKFDDTAMYFDGSGDRLLAPSSENFAMGTGDFTVECWFNATSSSARGLFHITTGHLNSEATGIGLGISTTSGNPWRVYHDTTATDTSSNLVTGSWQHIAIVRNGTAVNVYLDGTSIYSATDGSDLSSYTYLTVGAWYSSSFPWIGYIENLQILKGVAKYTQNFTPPNRTQGITYQAES